MKLTALPLTLIAILITPIALAVKPAENNVKWREDPLCQFVFFAVLEGLYRDGVQNEVVDLVLGKDLEPLKEEEEIKRNFVFQCELCHATYEAFKTYRARPAFANSAGQSTFGKGVPGDHLTKLKHDDAATRVIAMGDLVRPWIQQRVVTHRLTEEEQAAMKKEFNVYLKKGAAKLEQLKKEPNSVYVDWIFYGTCQACEAAKDF